MSLFKKFLLESDFYKHNWYSLDFEPALAASFYAGLAHALEAMPDVRKFSAIQKELDDYLTRDE